MKIISPSFEILTPLDGQAVLMHIELCRAGVLQVRGQNH